MKKLMITVVILLMLTSCTKTKYETVETPVKNNLERIEALIIQVNNLQNSNETLKKEVDAFNKEAEIYTEINSLVESLTINKIAKVRLPLIWKERTNEVEFAQAQRISVGKFKKRDGSFIYGFHFQLTVRYKENGYLGTSHYWVSLKALRKMNE